LNVITIKNQEESFMSRRRNKKENISLDDKLANVIAKIRVTEETLKNLKREKIRIERQIEEQKRERLYRSVLESGKTIEEIFEIFKTNNTEEKEES
jgi:hypothetical protein